MNWAIDRGLWGQFLAGPVIEALAQGQLAGRDFVMQECDGKLVSAKLNEEGAAFAEKYYDAYLKDYQQVLVKDLSSDYPVDDNAANRNKIAALLDQRFANWKQRAWWKFW